MNGNDRIWMTWAVFVVISGVLLGTLNITGTHWGFFVMGLVGVFAGSMATGHIIGLAQGIKRGKAEGFVLGYDRAKREDYESIQRAQQLNQEIDALPIIRAWGQSDE